MTARIWLHILVLCALLLPALPGAPAQAQGLIDYIYVNEAATGSDNGTSWTDAYTDLQDALSAADSGDVIWVAEGTYRPTSGNNRDATFALPAGVAIIGGFAGTETELEQRDWLANPTVLSGDIGTEGDNTDNVYHVVTGGTITSTSSTILDGFIITRGYADGDEPDDRGGGIYNWGSPLQVAHVEIANNVAGQGGGIFNSGQKLSIGFAQIGANEGGGIHNAHGGELRLMASQVSGNGAGGITNHISSTLVVTNSTIAGNQTDGDGGGILNMGWQTLTNCTISGNSANGSGGGIMEFSSLLLTNLDSVTITGNEADADQDSSGDGGGLANLDSTVNVHNSILAGNKDLSEEGTPYPDCYATESSGFPSAKYNLIGEETGCDGLFADPSNLVGTDTAPILPALSPLADNGGETLTHALQWNSPALDANLFAICPATDQRGEPRPQDGDGDSTATCDMGAFEAPTGVAGIDLEKWTLGVDADVPPGPLVQANDLVTWTYAITNTGTVSLSDVVVVDNVIGEVMGPVALLPPGQVMTSTVTGVASVGYYSNTATVAATPYGTSVSVSDSDASHYLGSGRIYVDSTAAGDDNGTTWEDAFTDLQDALAWATPGSEIWVAEGMYEPTDGADPAATFQLKNSVAVYGGFAGTEMSLEQRDWEEYVTELSGALSGGANSYHVVTGSGTDSTAVLDGFLISNGHADGPDPHCYGGGMFNQGGSPTVRNILKFVDNEATCSGGGMYNEYSSPTLENVTFSANTADEYGGGMFNEGSHPVLTDVSFTANEALAGGGGMADHGSSPTLADVEFIDNRVLSGSGLGGGAIYNDAGSIVTLVGSALARNNSSTDGGAIANAGMVTLTDSTIIGNTASGKGGGIFNDISGSMAFQACTLANNVADEGGGVLNGGDLTLVNSTISGNKANMNGGGIADVGGGEINLYNVTVTGNLADADKSGDGDAGGLSYNGSDLEVWNSILAGNLDKTPTAGETLYPDCRAGSGPSGTPVNYSLIGDYTGCADLIGDKNLVGDGDNPLDPSLYRLADNGGPTPTHALLGDSPARDTGNPAGCYDPDGVLLTVDQRGMLRPQEGDGEVPAICDMGAYEASLDNDAWTRALRLEVSEAPYWDAADQHLDIPGQSRWYKFRVQPGSRVTVELDPGNANLDLVLYQDILAAYERLEDFMQASDLVSLTAEFAADAFAPDSYAADAFSSEAYAPMAFSPMAFSPMAFSPMAFSPMAFSPMAFSPMAFSPMAFSPMAFSPMAFSPMAFSPMAFSPGDVVLDDAYSVAQMLTIVGVSAFDGLASELITVNTWDNSGDFYVRVTGRNGAFDPPAPPPLESVPFHLTVMEEVGVCGGVDLIERDPINVAPGSLETLILVDWQRMDLEAAELAALQGAVDAFAGQVGGVVVDVGADPLVAEANTEADDTANVACPFAKNQVARLIKDIVNAYREANPEKLKYVVIVGDDDVIPFFRHPDRALLANEKNYIPPVFNDTASFASLHLGYVLSQDYYGSAVDLSLNNTLLPVPQLAVGRLVETPSDIITLLEAYADLAGGALVPQSAFVSGYDFLADAARAVSDELLAGIGSGADELISAAEVSPLDPAAWRADELRDGLLSRRHDAIFLAGHFSASGALAADFQTQLSASELANSPVDLRNALVFSVGCHSGYNIVTEHGIPNVTVEPDWAQAFAQKGVTFVGGTGYQYGDTDFLEYSERLYLEFAKHLRYGTGPVTVGEALVDAKQAYLAGTAEMRGIHEKALLEATLFGLPMLSVDMPQGRGDPPVPSSIVPGTAGFPAPGPGASLGLRYADVTVDSDLTQHTVTLYSVDDLGADPPVTIDVDYFSGTDGVVVNPVEPVLPLERRNVSMPGLVLRGIGILRGSYTDHAGLIPLTGAATTELRGVHPPFFSDVFYPIKPWRANYFDVLADPINGITWLHVTPAQFVSPDLVDWAGILRAFNSMDLRLYYSANTTTYPKGAVPALSAAPTIARVLATEENGQVTFNAWVVGDPAAGIQEVWVTHTSCNDAGLCNGMWDSLFLTQDAADSTLWTGVLNVAAPGDLRYIVQAVNGVGLLSIADNLGHYSRVGVDPADPSVEEDPADTDLELQSPASTGAYSTEETFTAWLTSNGDPVAGQKIQFALGAQERWATTDAGGYATVKIPLLGPPGEHRLLASFAGSVEYGRSSAVTSFTIQKQGTQLQLLPQTASPDYGLDAVLVAKLTDAAGRPLREKSLGFVVDVDSANTADDYAFTGITDLTGQVLLGPSSLPQGDYTLRVYFGREVLLPSGDSLELSDVNYADSEASHIVGNAPALWGITIDPSPIAVGTLIEPSASFTYPGSVAGLRAVWDWGDGSLSEGTVSDGTVSGSHTYITPGVYTLRLVLADQSGACDEAIYEYIVVYDDSQGFATGGGWIDSPASAYPADPELTGRANFGFVAKYKKRVDVPIGQTEFQFQTGDLNFHSDSYEWLRVARHKAMFKGEGTINGTGNYGFLLSAIDADLTPSTAVDLFRIKIWNTGTDEIVYDNQVGAEEDADPTTALGGGDIVIHAR